LLEKKNAWVFGIKGILSLCCSKLVSFEIYTRG
jgi:hypothetical protein